REKYLYCSFEAGKNTHQEDFDQKTGLQKLARWFSFDELQFMARCKLGYNLNDMAFGASPIVYLDIEKSQQSMKESSKASIMSSPVGWQVDLPGLSSLVMSMGAAGLKKIAQAGVDIHTLLCMGEIAEICPASLEYRREINNCRQKQRKQSIWIYKFVEIGTASNFIADELLKKRAGENIVALMSTVLPILSEDDCDSFILRLFEASKIHADKTPGLGQLQSFRDAILSLAQKLDFKDRTYQYHVLLDQLRSQDQQPLRTSIPNIKLLAQVITMLQKVVLDDDARYARTYRGWAGAAWVITYARHVLGLPVCVLRTAQDSVPINGDYQNSRVFVYIFEQKTCCELVLDGKVSDLVTPTVSIERTVWAVDVENVNLRGCYTPDDPSTREAASVIIRSLALLFAAWRTESLRFSFFKKGATLPDISGLIPYAVYCLPSIRYRALKVLDLMGFRVRADIEPDENTWQDFLLRKKSKILRPGLMCMRSFLPCKDRSSRVLSTADYQGFDNQGRKLLKRMYAIADAASCLAFSDWGENLKLINTSVFEDGLPQDFSSYHFVSSKNLVDEGDSMDEDDSVDEEGFVGGENPIRVRLEWLPKRSYNMSGLTRILSRIVIGNETEPTRCLTALECQNVVFARAAATEDSISLDAKFIQVYPGHIRMLGERRMEIRSSKVRASIGHVDFGSQATAEYYPYNGLGELSIKSMSRLSRTCIEVTRSLANRGSVFELNCPSLASDEILRLYVTKKCTHPYYSRAAVASERQHVTNGFYLRGSPMRPESLRYKQIIEIILQAVDQNPCGQWASVHDYCSTDILFQSHIRILQRDRCIQCIVDLIKYINEGNHHSRNPLYCTIIPGRLQGEEMGEAVIDTGIHQSPMDTSTE
ncbi:MAG: hypothetical protein Q9188_007522, partial [Gyalolechia gomerana]